MPQTLLLDPPGLRERLARRFAGKRREWLAGAGEWPTALPLGMPTERLAREHTEQVRAWQSAWLNWQGPGTIDWIERQWPTLGVQRLPASIRFESAEDVAECIGERAPWARARERFRELSAIWPPLIGVLPAHYALLAEWPSNEFTRLVDTLHWLQAHPRAGVLIRQLPVPGIDSKWLESRQAVVCEWLSAITNQPPGRDIYTLTGLRRVPATLRLRLLDPRLRARVGGLGDIQAPVEEIATLGLPFKHALLVENLQTGLAFDDMPESVVLMSQGYAVDLYAQLPWLQTIDCLYWGDIDTHGFAILDRLRSHLPGVRSILMDQDTLLAHRSLWVEESQPARASRLSRLDADEQRLFQDIASERWGPRVRLEQERIPWPWVITRLPEPAP